MKSCMYNCQGAGGWIVLTSERTRLIVFHCVLFIFTKSNSSVSLWTSFEVVQPILGLLLNLIHSFFVSGEVPCVWSEWYLPGCRRVWHPCLHLQAVVWGPQLHRYEDKQKKVKSLSRFSTSMHVTFTPDLFLFNHRPYRIGDWGGLWRECPVPDFYSNGQKPQILQFVKNKSRNSRWGEEGN